MKKFLILASLSLGLSLPPLAEAHHRQPVRGGVVVVTHGATHVVGAARHFTAKVVHRAAHPFHGRGCK